MDDLDRRREQELSRRALLRRAGLGAGSLIVLPSVLAACGGSDDGTSSSAAASSAAPATAAETAAATTAATAAETAASTAAETAAAGGESAELKALLDAITSKKVIVGSYGGGTEEARKKAWWDPFTERTGVEVVVVDIPGVLGDDMLTGKIPSEWDAFHGSPQETQTALDTGTKPLPEVPVFAQEDLFPEDYRKYSWGSFFLAYVPAFMPGTYPDDAAPKSWADFFDTKKFPGKRAWPGKSYIEGTREAALLADGVAPEDLYPIDVARAHAKIESIWDDLVFYDEYSQISTFLTTKTVAMTFAPNGIYAGMQRKGVDVNVVWDAVAVLNANNMSILPESPNPDAIQALAAFVAQPDRQAEFAVLTNYGPPSTAAFSKLTPEQIAILPNNPDRVSVTVDAKATAAVYDELVADNEKLFS